jgi:hypothetical protein
MTCDTCGQELHIGDWPYCPHGRGNNLQRPMEPHVDEMLADSPREFSTISEKVRYMDRHAIIPRHESRHFTRPEPGLRPTHIREAIRETIQEIREGRYGR